MNRAFSNLKVHDPPGVLVAGMAFRFSLVLLLLFLVACTSTVIRPGSDQYALKVEDNPAAYRFDIVLQSHDPKPLCIPVENWPSREGQLHMGSDLATLHTTTGILAARDENFGYCPGGCGQHQIAPGSKLHGFIAYEAFGDPVQLAMDAGKRLQFTVSLSYCKEI